MKKPNITKGEWSLNVLRNGMDYHINSPECMVIKVEHSQYWRDAEEAEFCIPRWMADAKAISAVPEMIDALIESYYQLSTLVNDGIEHSRKDEICLEKIEQALKKAGCHER